MSLRPSKHSDKNKAWMQPRKDRVKKIQPEYHLIVTEGTKTEPAYFESIQNAINQQYRGRIQLDIYGEGNNTLSLFHKAKKRVREIPGKYKHVWIVFDTDDFPEKHINETEALCQKENTPDKETIYHAIWSNQCIELWFLLHFCYFQSDIHRSAYYPKLSDHLKSLGKGAYTKNRKDIYQILSPYMANAIRFAKMLEEENKGKKPSQAAPGTKVYVLIEMLKPYL